MIEKWSKFRKSKTYIISNNGKIKNSKTNLLIKPWIHKSRSGFYLRITIGGKNYMVHKIVNEHFPNNDDDLMLFDYEVDHIDGNTLNSSYYNLRRVTPEQNKHFYQQRRRLCKN